MNKIMRFAALSAAGVILSLPLSGSAQIIIQENFDSYANQGALDAVWPDDTAGETLQTSGGHSGANFLRHPTTAARKRWGGTFSVVPTTTAPLVLDFWIKHDSTAQGRVALQLWESTGALHGFSYGNYNTVTTPGWMYRVLGGGAGGTWTAAGGTRGPINTWKNLKAKMLDKDVEFYENGILISTNTARTSNFPAMTVLKTSLNNSTTPQAVSYTHLTLPTNREV